MEMMKPIVSEEIPIGDEWRYEVKYDGFRCTLYWRAASIRLISKNNKDLTANFPEIVAACQQLQPMIADFLPLILDGELCVLNNPFQANFGWMQKRGRLKNTASIEQAAQQRPATYMTFDLLQEKGSSLLQQSHEQRRKKLHHILHDKLPASCPIQLVACYQDAEILWKKIFDHKGEGLIAKRRKSVYASGKNHRDWLKIKNWRKIHAILTSYQPSNDYFQAAVWEKENGALISIGTCKHGLDTQARQTISQLFIENGHFHDQSYTLPPAIVAKIKTLDLYEGELREPGFAGILTDTVPVDCTIERLKRDQAMLPDTVEYSKLDKLYWPKADLNKADYLVYMREISPYMLPFLREHLLTLIRCPEGVEEESFFQKHLPDYAPDFISGVRSGDETFMVCDSLESLLWFANHGGIEFHIPFEKAKSTYPNEIVFDLDPPNRDRFDLAVKAANVIKMYLDQLKLSAFVKLSGNKGLQIHIPIAEKSMSYEQTALFTQAIAQTVENQYPKHFTTERLKKNRHGRLYIDYVQHGKNKTIIAPYSARKTEEGTVAAPLRWEEVNENLQPQHFTIRNVADRVKDIGCPFATYEQIRKQQNLSKVFTLLGQSSHDS